MVADNYPLTHQSFIAPGNPHGSVVQDDQFNCGNHSSAPGCKSAGNAAGDQKPLQSKSGSREPICNYCKCRGHVISGCWSSARKRNNPSSDP